MNKYMGLPERSETMELLHLKFARQSNFPEIPIEDCLGDAIVVLTDAIVRLLKFLLPSERYLNPLGVTIH